MKWEKLGRVFCSDNNFEWMLSHNSNPIPVQLSGSVYRVFFSCRKEKNVSSVGFVDFDIKNPTEALRISDVPSLSPGKPGRFDENGISIGCIVPRGDKYWLYYLGWNLLVSVPWHNSIGLAIADDLNSEFKRFSEAPIYDRNIVEPISFSYPWIMYDKNIWRMWYGCNLTWAPEQRDMDHYPPYIYVIKYAESEDGINWTPKDHIAIGIEEDNEYAIARPCVVKVDGKYHMWYSYKGDKYRIGFASSNDGISWQRRDDDVGISVSESGWDSEEVCYAHVFKHENDLYMVYNGNEYGKTGFGLAKLEEW